MKNIFYLLCVLSLCACTSQYGRYQQKHDSKPSRAPLASEMVDPIPKYEPYNKANNRPYTIHNKNYTVLKSAKNFTQTGTASWYGKKFHGHLTANGEIYNMYSMSAAHKSLPLPTYLKVTNLENNKSIIVRANDRGPFHEDRIIDLSYSAAYKLGMLKTGTAQVKITAITEFNQGKTTSTPKLQSTKAPLVKPQSQVAQTPKKIKKTTSKNTYLSHTYIQVLSTQNKLLADKTAEALAILHQKDSTSIAHDAGYRVVLGPFNSNEEINTALNRLKERGYDAAFKKIILPAYAP